MVVRVVAIVQTAVKGAAEHLAEIDAGKRVAVPSVGDPPEKPRREVEEQVVVSAVGAVAVDRDARIVVVGSDDAVHHLLILCCP